MQEKHYRVIVNKRLSYLIKTITVSPVDDKCTLSDAHLSRTETACMKKRSIKPSEMRIVKSRYEK